MNDTDVFGRIVEGLGLRTDGRSNYVGVLLDLFRANARGEKPKPRDVARKASCSEMTAARALKRFEEVGVAKRLWGNRWKLAGNSLTAALAGALDWRILGYKSLVAYAQLMDNTYGLKTEEPLPSWYEGMRFPIDNENGVTPAHRAFLDESGKILTISDKAGTKDKEKHNKRSWKDGLFPPFSAFNRLLTEFSFPLSYSLAPISASLSPNGGF